MTLAGLRERMRRRRRGLRRQARLWLETGKRGHGKAAREHAAAMKNLRKKIISITRVEWISQDGIDFIASFEGFPNRGRPYNDPVGYATVGYGHLIGYRPVTSLDLRTKWLANQGTPGKLTKREAKRLLRQDLRKSYEPAVRKLFTRGGPFANRFEQGLYDALVSFAYNLGPGSVQGSGGFETMGRAIAAGDKKAVAEAALLYDKASGRALAGLTRRRQAERHLILTGQYH